MTRIPIHAADPARWFRFAAICLIGVAAAGSLELFRGWRHSSLDAFAWMAFLIWLLPVWFAPLPRNEYSPACLGAGAACVAGGLAAGMDPLIYFGLALGLASFAPGSSAKLPWLASAAAWMPFFPFLGSGPVPGHPAWLRIGTVLMGVVLYAWAALLLLEERPRRPRANKRI